MEKHNEQMVDCWFDLASADCGGMQIERICSCKLFHKEMKMRWLGRLFGAVPKEEMEGISLDRTRSYWEVDGIRTFVEVFNALRGWLPEGAVLYFEGGSPDPEIEDFLSTYSIPEQAHVAMGTIWPRPRVFHVPATEMILTELGLIMENHAEPELAVHFHVYRNNLVLLEWYDAFAQPILISGTIGEAQIKVFVDKAGGKFKKIIE